MESRLAVPKKKEESKSDEPLKAAKPTKLVVRLLPPALSSEDFYAILHQLILPDLVESTYYVQGHYSKRPFKQPTYSRCYLRLKDEKLVNSLYLALSTVMFKNSARMTTDENGESGDLNLEEEFKPKVEKALFNEMNFPHGPMERGPLDNTIEETAVYKLFLESLEQNDDGESILQKAEWLEKKKAKKQNKKKKQQKSEANGEAKKSEDHPTNRLDSSFLKENIGHKPSSVEKTKPKKRPKKAKKPKPDEGAPQGKPALEVKPNSAEDVSDGKSTLESSPSEPVKKRKPRTKKKAPKPANSPKPKAPAKVKEPKSLNSPKPSSSPKLNSPKPNSPKPNSPKPKPLESQDT